LGGGRSDGRQHFPSCFLCAVLLYRLSFFGHLHCADSRQDHHRALQACIAGPTDNWRWRIGRPRQSWLRTATNESRTSDREATCSGPIALADTRGNGYTSSQTHYTPKHQDPRRKPPAGSVTHCGELPVSSVSQPRPSFKPLVPVLVDSCTDSVSPAFYR